MIGMSVRDIDRVYTLHFFWIKFYLGTAFHEIAYGVVREPGIDEDPYIVSGRIRYIDEELGMSERSDDHVLVLWGRCFLI